ncbi:MAG: hypothetical protein HOP10_09900 [Chitinophagaceae bacterium]|nr:hypothetical protein [Chitinophagaceae bacterium]
MYKILLLPVFFIATAVSAQNYVTLYEDCNYSGPSYSLEPGNYRLYQMKIGNDRLSSIQIPYGFKITLYMDDNFVGGSKTYTTSITCLPAEWNDNTSSIVVENTLGGNYSQNDYVTFYNNSSYGGYSQSLRPGSYTGAQLGTLRYNISSFKINGNLQVKVYLNNENLSGYNSIYTESQSYLSSNVNDKIGSLIIEAKTTQPANNGNNSSSYATFYSECNYDGNALRLMPGYYSGEKLGVLKYAIGSIQIPSTLRVKAFINNDNLYGQSTELTGNNSCLDYNLKNRIGSLVVEDRGYGNNNNNNNSNEVVIIYTDEDYKGQSASLLPGSYSTMSQAGFTDNSLSSLTVPDGYRVVIYEFENFGGKSYTITASKTKFYLSNWNDKTSSIVVYRDR